MEAFLNEYDPLRLIKSLIMQMARLTHSLQVIMPSLVQILKEHCEINPVEVEWLMKMLEEKEVELVEQAKEADRWSLKEFDLQALL